MVDKSIYKGIKIQFNKDRHIYLEPLAPVNDNITYVVHLKLGVLVILRKDVHKLKYIFKDNIDLTIVELQRVILDLEEYKAKEERDYYKDKKPRKRI